MAQSGPGSWEAYRALWGNADAAVPRLWGEGGYELRKNVAAALSFLPTLARLRVPCLSSR